MNPNQALARNHESNTSLLDDRRPSHSKENQEWQWQFQPPVSSARLASAQSYSWNWLISLKPILRPFWIVFPLYFLICHFAKHCLLLPLSPDLSNSVLVSHWRLQSRVKAAEKKETRDLAFSRWLECQPRRAPGNLLLLSPVISRSFLILSRQTPTHRAQAKARWFP